jgi:2,3-bisphosphoglycerate-independent phosphoglycerate mutase
MRGDGRQVLLVLLDGAADRPASALDGRTPLEAAETPALDRLVAAGVSGLADVGPPGLPMPSDRAHARLFGYDPDAVPRRGVLEARGLGVEVPETGVTAAASFARLESGGDPDPPGALADRSLSGSRERCRDDADAVAAFETDGVAVSFEYTWKNRGILTLESAAPLDPGVTDTDPFESGLPVVRPEPTAGADDGDAAARTADALAAYTRWSVERLRDADSDVVLSKWAGTPTGPEPFAERHGMAAVSLTPKPVVAGLADTLGMAARDPPDGYGDRAAAVRAALDSFEFVHAHYPEPDEVAHAGTPLEKRDELEAIDRSLSPVVEAALGRDLVAVVTADHTTPSVGNVVHSGEAVPVTIAAPTARADDVAATGERNAAAGALGRIDGGDVLRIARSLADRVLLDGLRRTPGGGTVPTSDVRPLFEGGPP